MHKSATKCNETIGKWCKNKHGASKIIDTFETYHAATSAASGVFGMMLPCSSTDKKDESRFLERFLHSECSRLSIRGPCLLCLLLFVCDALLHALCIALLAAPTDSLLFHISLFSFPVVLPIDLRRSGILKVPLCLRLLGWLHHC
jgi:hypothetical protein